MAGFTTCRDVGSAEFIDIGLRNAVASGKIAGPRMLVAVKSIGATGGHCDPGGGVRYGLRKESGVEQGVINSADEARAAVRFNLKYGADVIKTCATGGVLSATDEVDTPQMTQAELDALVDEAHALRRKTQVDQGKLLLRPAVVAKARAAWGSVGQTFSKAVSMGVRI